MTSARHQPQYDFISGPETNGQANASARSTSTRRVSVLSKPELGNEDLRAQIHKLQYELDSIKQERDAAALRHDEELRQVQSKAEADFKRAQASESSSTAASGRYDAIAQELEDLKEQSATEKRELEKRFRSEQDEKQALQEELEDLRAQQSSQERQSQRDISDLEAKLKTTQNTAQELQSDLDEKSSTLLTTQQKLSQRETAVADLENEILRLKTQNGDADTFDVIKRELSEQVEHIKELESTNLNQAIELKQLRKQQKTVEIVEEEKRSLEAKVRIMNDLRKELSEAQLQKQILEDERKSWTSYLEGIASDDEDMQFDKPEDLAKAFVKERYEKASLVDQLGKVTPELNSKDDNIRALEEQITKLKSQSSSQNPPVDASDAKSRSRLERQRTLALKEVEYLRAQLKAFDSEETELQSDTYDEQKAKRIQELEDLTEQYRNEIKSLHDELDKSKDTAQATNPLKRAHEDNEEPDERLGELSRKNRALQDSITQAYTSKAVLEKELEACKSQLSAAKLKNKTRVLELRQNPTATATAAKQSTLDALRAENAALLAKLESPDAPATGKSSTRSKASAEAKVPAATVERLRTDMAAKDEELAQKDKHIVRLKQIFSSKSREFREAVASILGWKFDFLPNGRVRVTSLFNAGVAEEEGGEGSNSIVFDGDNETMKVSGGPQSAFASEIRPLVEFWVDGRNEIPCFLAAATLEFWERNTRAQKQI